MHNKFISIVFRLSTCECMQSSNPKKIDELIKAFDDVFLKDKIYNRDELHYDTSIYNVMVVQKFGLKLHRLYF